jgi:neurotransmitter:Na+ symporter, NSS family
MRSASPSSSVKTQAWSSRLGVILAVAGSAVGLGNFLRFPGLAAQYGGGAFMVAYFVSLLIIGLPICWAEWTMGRAGGRHGYHSSPGIFHALLRHRSAKYLGVIGLLIPVVIYMYYLVVEAWCLGYAVSAASGTFQRADFDSVAFFRNYTGLAANGAGVGFTLEQAGLFLVSALGLNLWFVYRGLAKGIERVCLWGMPLLIVLALIVLARVLTLGTPDPARPELSVAAGLEHMWSTADLVPRLANAELWLAAAGQVFFTLSVGFGLILNYASYLTARDDVPLSALSAAATNEFCEVGLGGLITVPAAFAFFGAAGASGGAFGVTFGLGFNTLPEVFARMPAGQWLGAAFFFLLFIAAITSSLSMIQPAVAFVEEALNFSRGRAVAVVGALSTVGTGLIWYFSAGLDVLDTLDFWVGNVLIFIQATILIIIYAWVLDLRENWRQMHIGALIRVPVVFRWVTRYLTPTYLLIIFALFLLQKIIGWNFAWGAAATFKPTGRISALIGEAALPAAQLSIVGVFGLTLITAGITHLAGRRWTARDQVGAQQP